MAKKKTVFLTRHLPDIVEERARRDYRVTQFKQDFSPSKEQIIDKSQGCDAILCCITETFSRDVIEALPDSVKVISTFSVGTDHLDLDAAREKGISVGYAPNGVTISTAEIAMMLMLTAAHRAPEGQHMVRAKQWYGWGPQQLLGRRLFRKRLGIFGMGKIGQAFAQRARGFDMEIHYHNRNRLPKEKELGAIYHDSLDGLLAVSDILSIHAPATVDTRHIINADALHRLPDEAIVINTARGDLVKDEDLIAALKSRKLFAAGLDVFEGEPAIHEGYYDLENVFLLPHVGSATLEAREEMGFEALDNIDAILQGKKPPYPVF